MRIHTETLTLQTKTSEALYDITAMLQSCVKQSNIKMGQLSIFIPHTTAAVTVNENTDPDVAKDMTMSLQKNIPDDPAFRHLEGNAHAHVKASVIGPSLTLHIQDARLLLGTWQGVFFCEFDGPRHRKIHVQAWGT
ncbi:MAG: YjbQ family protein [Acholeplasmatales bacterium]|nr:MAG: YjbQ family protein [Acholeplasmatales bacterium]